MKLVLTYTNGKPWHTKSIRAYDTNTGYLSYTERNKWGMISTHRVPLTELSGYELHHDNGAVTAVPLTRKAVVGKGMLRMRRAV